MSTPQYLAYAAARDKETEETKRGAFKSKPKPFRRSHQGASSSYQVRSRQLSNFLYPDYALVVTKDERGYERTEKFPDKLEPTSFDIHSGNMQETWGLDWLLAEKCSDDG